MAPTWMVRAAYAGSRGSNLGMGRELNPALYAVGATTATTNQRRPLFPNFGHDHDDRADRALDLELAAADHRQALCEGLHAARQLHLLEDARSLLGQQAEWRDADQPLRPRVRLGSGELRPASSAGGVLAVGDSGASGQQGARRGGGRLGAHRDLDVADRVCPSRWRAASTTPAPAPAASAAIWSAIPSSTAIATRSETITEWFETSAYTANALGTFGNAGRNALRGPRFATVDLGLQKTFPVTGTLKTQLRIEAFNVLNNVNLGLPVSALNNASVGRIQSAADPRIMQIALRVMF